MNGADTGVKAFFLGLGNRLLGCADALAILDESSQLGIFFSSSPRQRVIRCECQKMGAKQGIRPCCIDFERCIVMGNSLWL